jgi:hypothetical protein
MVGERAIYRIWFGSALQGVMYKYVENMMNENRNKKKNLVDQHQLVYCRC